MFMSLPITLSAAENNTYNVNVDKAGDYYLEVTYVNDPSVSVIDAVNVNINGVDNGPIRLEKNFEYTSDEFETDRYGKEIVSTQQVVDTTTTSYLSDSEDYQNTPKAYKLNEGSNVVKLTPINSTVEIQSIRAVSEMPVAKVGSETSTGVQVTKEGEAFEYKNAIQINAKSKPKSSYTPLSPGAEHMNTIDSKTFDEHGQKITYSVDVEQAGNYDLYLSGATSGFKNFNMYFNVYVNGLMAIENQRVAVENKYDEILFDAPLYLEQGENLVTIEITAAPFKEILDELEYLRKEVTALSSSVKQITGGIEDASRDWGLTDFIPGLVESLEEYKEVLNTMRGQVIELSSEDVEIVNSIDLMISNLDELIIDADNIPNHYSLLADGTTSVLALVNQSISTISTQGFELDKFYLVSSGEELNTDSLGFFGKSKFNTQSFFASFSTKQVDDQVFDDEIEIWVNKPRQYVDVMQKVADQEFTPDTGIKVNFSVITNQTKLTLANAANETPDVAVSLDSWYAYELGLRGALVDLNAIDGIEEMIARVTPGGLLQVIVNDSLYGISETQDLYVMYYRTDVFDTYGFDVPNTWDEVVRLLPELQGNGMNFFIPLSGPGSLKSFPLTAPFFMQNEVPIFKSNALGTNLDTPEGLESLNNMVTMYELNGLDISVANFFDSFKSGEVPIGVSNFSTYIQLSNAANEIKGNWAIAPVPGMVNDDGEVLRWHPGSTTVDVIFENSQKKEQSAEFLKWWTSTEAQNAFNDMLVSIYGMEYIWNSANIEAFLSLPLPQKDLAVFATSLEWIEEVPKIPGGYIVERSISDIWNGVIFDGDDLKTLTEEKVDDINVELEKKLIEFNYIDEDGNILKEYEVPTVEKVKSWAEVSNE